MNRSRERKDASLFARAWVVASPVLERIGLAESRRRLVDGLSGTVVEVGAGSGVTFEHYPPEVTRVVAVEPDPHLRAYARRHAQRAAVDVEVVDTVAEMFDYKTRSSVIQIWLTHWNMPQVAGMDPCLF